MFPLSVRWLVELAEGQEIALGLFMLGAGLVFMLLGTRIVRPLLMVSFGAIGFAVGVSLPLDPTGHWIAGCAMALSLGLAAGYFARAALSILAGLWAGGVMGTITAGLGAGDELVLIVACLAFGGAVSLAFVVQVELAAAVTSFQGALLFLAGLVVFVSHQPMLWAHFRELLLNKPLFGAFIILAGTIAGAYAQLAEVQKKQLGLSG